MSQNEWNSSKIAKKTQKMTIFAYKFKSIEFNIWLKFDLTSQYMQSIKSIDELVASLDEATPKDYPLIAKSINIDPEDFYEYATWEPRGYTRNCIARTDDYELILICWDAGAVTPLHGHDGQDCWVYQVTGEMTELRYDKEGGKLKKTNEMAFSQGSLAYMHDRMGYHVLKNLGDTRCMTLHCYMKPVESCEVFDAEKGRFVTQELHYDTFEGEPIKESA